MMGQLTQYLDQILDWHTRSGSSLSRYLQPGLSEIEIRKKIAVLPFMMPDEFVEVYMWRNGTPAHNQEWVSFIENQRFLSLDEALEIFQSAYPIMKQFYENSDWVMVFEDGSSDGYGSSSIKESSSAAAPVVFLFEGDGVHIVFESLTQMMRTMVAAFQGEVFCMGKDGDIETDFHRFGEVAHKLNPDIPYWTQYSSYPRSS
jgi:hypothetical protein